MNHLAFGLGAESGRAILDVALDLQLALNIG